MAFAITEINRDPSLLPNVTLGYSLHDNCVTLGVSFRAALSLVSGREEQFHLDESCVGSPPVLGIVGPSTSSSAIALSRMLGPYRVPIVGFYLECLINDLFYIDLVLFIWLFTNVKYDK